MKNLTTPPQVKQGVLVTPLPQVLNFHVLAAKLIPQLALIQILVFPTRFR